MTFEMKEDLLDFSINDMDDAQCFSRQRDVGLKMNGWNVMKRKGRPGRNLKEYTKS